MARQKRNSKILQKAERRAAGMRSIEPNLDLGNDMTVQNFWNSINRMRQTLITYNTLLSTVDQVRSTVIEQERALAHLSERMLSAVVAKYGRDSAEYEMSGGSRRPQRYRKTSPEPTTGMANPEELSSMISDRLP